RHSWNRSAPSHPEAAVDEEHFPGDEGGLVRAEEAYRPRDVLRLAEALERRVREHELAHVVGDRAREPRVDVARRYDVHAPVTSAVLPSSEQNAGASGSSEGLLELLDRGEAVHGDRLHAAVDPLHEAREDVTRADLDEGAHALARELARRLRE